IIPPLEVDFFLKWFLTLRLYYRTVRPLHQLIYFISRIETKKTKKHCFTRVVSRYIRGLDITNFSIHAFSVHFLLMIGYNEDILSTHAFLCWFLKEDTYENCIINGSHRCFSSVLFNIRLRIKTRCSQKRSILSQ